MAGRKPKSKQAKVIQGTFRKDRENPSAPVPSSEMPQAPDWFAGRKREIFDALTEQLQEIGLASATYEVLQGLLAARIEEAEALSAALAEHGTTYETETQTGTRMVRQRPEVGLLNSCMRHIQSLLGDFGLSPAAINRVARVSSATHKENPFASLGKGDDKRPKK